MIKFVCGVVVGLFVGYCVGGLFAMTDRYNGELW